MRLVPILLRYNCLRVEELYLQVLQMLIDLVLFKSSTSTSRKYLKSKLMPYLLKG